MMCCQSITPRPETLPINNDSPEVTNDSFSLNRPSPRTPTSQKIISEFARKNPGNWKKTGKVWAPRVLLARFESQKNLPETNSYLQGVQPWSRPGSSWAGHSGDYDFTEVTLTTILYRFGDRPKILFPETRRHILNSLLLEEGGEPRLTVPKSLGTVYETENHVLMTESSRFLKNQWMWDHGHKEPRYNNAENGLFDWLTGYLNRIQVKGFYEFNSVPYQGYATQALLNLEAFAEADAVKGLARRILDQMTGHYALGSLQLRQVVPFRRQLRRADSDSLTLNYVNAIMSVWAAPVDGPARKIQKNRIHVFTAAIMDYRPPKRTLRLVREKPDEYFLRIGHGKSASPEIFSGGPGYLISAGGVYRGVKERIVARPTTLLLKDGAKTLDGCFHLPGEGKWRQWNNTGVHRRFACAEGPVHIPKQYKPRWQSQVWKIFAPAELSDYVVAVHTTDKIGLLMVVETKNRTMREIGAAFQRKNPVPKDLQHTFRWPSGKTLTYDVHAPTGQWVICEVNGERTSREYDQWKYPHTVLHRPARWIKSEPPSDD
ncbi:MAG: hypothetical protein ACLFWL_15655 [Candidatus Brocadiia bacterium]